MKVFRDWLQKIPSWNILAALSAENRRYRNIFETSSQRLFLKDEHLRYILCSRRYASDFNLSVDEIIGKYDEQLFPREVAGLRTQQERRILRTGQVDDAVEILNCRGRDRTLITFRTPVMDEDRRTVRGIFGVSLDASDYWRKVAELGKVNQQQEGQMAGLEIQLLSQDLELERLKNALQKHLEKIHNLQTFLDSTKKYLDSLENPR